jgi:hypothetical protein
VVIVPHEAVDVGNVTGAEFVIIPFDALLQFILLFTRGTLAYPAPDGSVAPVPSIFMGVVDSPKYRVDGTTNEEPPNK